MTPIAGAAVPVVHAAPARQRGADRSAAIVIDGAIRCAAFAVGLAVAALLGTAAAELQPIPRPRHTRVPTATAAVAIAVLTQAGVAAAGAVVQAIHIAAGTALQIGGADRVILEPAGANSIAVAHLGLRATDALPCLAGVGTGTGYATAATVGGVGLHVATHATALLAARRANTLPRLADEPGPAGVATGATVPGVAVKQAAA